MADNTNKLGYSQFNQIELVSVEMFRDGWKTEDYVDIRAMVDEINIYEDMFSPTISASMLVADGLNLPDKFPIIGGEHVLIRFKTPTFQDEVSQEFMVYKIGKKVADARNSKMQGYVLYLCTLDRYRDSYTDVSKSFKGTYKDIVNETLNILQSTKSLNSDPTLGNQKFISPFWSPLKICKWIAERAVGSKYEPFFFFEDLSGYNFKSAKTIYEQEPVTKIFIEMGQMPDAIDNQERNFERSTRYEVIDGNDRLQQHSDGLFGSKIYQYNATNKTLTLNEYDYTSMFDTPDAAKIEQYPLFDDVGKGNRQKRQFIMERADGSHLGAYYRKMMLGMLASYGLRIVVKGNSSLRVGSIVELDIPSKRAGEPEVEEVTSGRWLITSLKHIIKRDQYDMVLELSKDSYKQNIASLVTTGDSRNG